MREFMTALRSLFSYNGQPYHISEHFAKEMFDYFDANKVGGYSIR